MTINWLNQSIHFYCSILLIYISVLINSSYNNVSVYYKDIVFIIIYSHSSGSNELYVF